MSLNKKTLWLLFLTLLLAISTSFNFYQGTTYGKYVLDKNIDNIDLEIIAEIPKVDLQTASWEEIYDITVAGEAAEHWSVGDKTTVDINGTDYEVAIAGINHDGENTVTFVFTEKLGTAAMNDVSAEYEFGHNIGSWKESEMRNETLPTILSQMENKDLIKEVEKKTIVGYGTNSDSPTTLEVTNDKLFLLSYTEVFGDVEEYDWDTFNEGKQYEYFKTKANRIVEPNEYGYGVFWWLRTPMRDSEYYFNSVSEEGNFNGDVAACDNKVVPAFVIGETTEEPSTLDLLPPFELPENMITGKSFITFTMPNVDMITERAKANTPEGTKFYGWLIESEFAQVMFDNIDEVKYILEDTYSYGDEVELRLTPIYELVEEKKEFKAIIDISNLIDIEVLNIEVLNLENNEISFDEDIVLELSVIENYELPETIEILIDETSYIINTNGENDLEFITFIDNVITISSELAVNEITQISVIGKGVEKQPEEEQEKVEEENPEEPENTEGENGENNENTNGEETSPDGENSSNENEPVEPDNGETEVPEDETTKEPENSDGSNVENGTNNIIPDDTTNNEGDGEQTDGSDENITEEPDNKEPNTGNGTDIENPDNEEGNIEENILSAFIDLTGVENIIIKDLNKEVLENDDELAIENDKLTFFINPETDYELPEIISLTINDNEYDINTVEENEIDGIEFVKSNGKLIISSSLLTEEENVITFLGEAIKVEEEKENDETEKGENSEEEGSSSKDENTSTDGETTGSEDNKEEGNDETQVPEDENQNNNEGENTSPEDENNNEVGEGTETTPETEVIPEEEESEVVPETETEVESEIGDDNNGENIEEGTDTEIEEPITNTEPENIPEINEDETSNEVIEENVSNNEVIENNVSEQETNSSNNEINVSNDVTEVNSSNNEPSNTPAGNSVSNETTAVTKETSSNVSESNVPEATTFVRKNTSSVNTTPVEKTSDVSLTDKATKKSKTVTTETDKSESGSSSSNTTSSSNVSNATAIIVKED